MKINYIGLGFKEEIATNKHKNMSSQISSSECQLLNSSNKSPKMYKSQTPRKFVRSASLERFKKFNTYICSQNYYMALLAWLKMPHSKLQDSIERFIAILKFFVFTTFLPRLSYKLLRDGVHMCSDGIREQIIPKVYTFVDSVVFTKATVYAAFTSIFLQFAICLYYMSAVFSPTGGFLFMCTCLYLITQMNYNCLQYFVREEESVTICGRKVVVQKRLSRRDILGPRTISNMNLLN